MYALSLKILLRDPSLIHLNFKVMESATKPQSTTPSNEALLKALNSLCDARSHLQRAKLSESEKDAVQAKYDALASTVETLYIERIRQDYPVDELVPIGNGRFIDAPPIIE